ncbi:hypothetical protein RQP46_005163 [Phenoliferia psychrophenolica]
MDDLNSLALVPDDLALLVERFSKAELVGILASTPALVAHFPDAAQPFVDRLDAEQALLETEEQLEAERVERKARLEDPARFVTELLDLLPERGGEPVPAKELEETQKQVEEGLRALIAHVADPSHGLDVEIVLRRLARLDSAMDRTRSDSGQSPEIQIAWDYTAALSLAVEAQRDCLQPLERRRIASEFERHFQATLDWETIWYGYLYETSFDDYMESLEHDALNTPKQVLRFPARCKVPSARSSSLVHFLPFEILAKIISFAANEYIPHPKTVPHRADSLDTLRADLLRTLSLVGRAWRTIAQRELVKRPLVVRSTGLDTFLNMLQRRKLSSVVRELHLDGGKVVRHVETLAGYGIIRDHQWMRKMAIEADEAFEEGLVSKTASEKNLWTSLVRLGEQCRTLPSLRLSNLGNFKDVIEFILPLQLVSLTFQSVDFPTTRIEIPSTVRTLSFLHVKFSTTDRLLDNVRHLTPSHLDTLILLDCSTPDKWNTFNGFPNTSTLPSGKILETVTTLHLDASQTAAIFLATESLPAVSTLEFFTFDHNALDFFTPRKSSRPTKVTQARKASTVMQRMMDSHTPRVDERLARMVLSATCELKKLERIILPDENEWRAAWDEVQVKWGESDEREELALKVQAMEVVWK